MSRRVTVFATAAILVVGCAAETAGSADESWTVPDGWSARQPSPQLALDMWSAPVDCAPSELSWRTVPDAEMDDTCGGADVLGCYRHGADGTREIVMSAGVEGSPAVIAHELAHWVLTCAGVGADLDHHKDPQFHALIEAQRVALWM